MKYENLEKYIIKITNQNGNVREYYPKDKVDSAIKEILDKQIKINVTKCSLKLPEQIVKTKQPYNKTYSTINIGNQTWMTKNLNITDEGLGIDHWKNSKTGEVLYSYDAANRLSKKVQGYHIPTSKEWNKLAHDFDASCMNNEEKIPEYREYNNVETLNNKLNIKLSGRYCEGNFQNINSVGYFWTTDGYESDKYVKYFTKHGTMESYNIDKSTGCSVRLVADNKIAGEFNHDKSKTL